MTDELTIDDVVEGAMFEYPNEQMAEVVYHVDTERGVVLTAMEQDIDTFLSWMNASNAKLTGINDFVADLDVEDFTEESLE